MIIVDTSNEIGGDGDIPHPSISNARRMQACCSSVSCRLSMTARMFQVGSVGNKNPFGRSCIAAGAAHC